MTENIMESNKKVMRLLVKINQLHQPNATNPFIEKGTKYHLTLRDIDLISEMSSGTIMAIMNTMINSLNDPTFEVDDGVREELMFCITHFAYVVHNEDIKETVAYLYKRVDDFIHNEVYAMILGMYLHDELYNSAEYYVLVSHRNPHESPRKAYSIWMVAKYDMEDEIRSNLPDKDNDVCFVIKGISEEMVLGVFKCIKPEDTITFINFVKSALNYINSDVVVLEPGEVI